MCGISAIIDWGAGLSLPTAILHMHDQIPHRGPDGEGFLFVDARTRAFAAYHAGAVHGLQLSQPLRVGIGFRWLKIQDLQENAAQPMCSPDRSVWVALNGEIYNFSGLRVALQAQGHSFTTRSDTEVVLAAYQTWGTGCFAHFCGMWAMVIVDLAAHKVLISRDRFGIKPLFYCYDGTRLLLASEIKQIVAVLGNSVQANLRTVCNFLSGLRLHHGEETFFDGIMALPAATYVEINVMAPPSVPFVCKPYWNLADFFCPAPRQAVPFHEACAELDTRLRVSVQEHMAAQVHLGSLLSGGLDSSTVAALLTAGSESHRTPWPSFSLVFPEYPELDESPHIDIVSAHLDLHNVKTTFDAGWVKEHMPQITWTQEEPLIGMAWAAQYRIYQLAAEHSVRVVLDGLGADEVLAGYPRHQSVLLREWLQRLCMRALIHETMSLVRKDLRTLMTLTQQAVQALRRRWQGRRAAGRDCAWLSDEGKALLAQEQRYCLSPIPCRDPSRVQQMLYTDVRYGNLGTVLAVGDRNSMAHTIESRVPYLDHRIVEFAFQLPAHYKVGAGLRKRILRQIARHYLPASVVNRRDRIGFGLPQQRWLHTHWRDTLAEALESTVFRVSPLVHWERLRTFVEAFYAGHHHDAATIWRIYALWQWAEVYHVTLGENVSSLSVS